MRQAYDRNGIFNDSNNLFISFGADFCAEHEWGIAGIQSAFDCSDMRLNGAERYLINKVPKNVKLREISFTKNKKKYDISALYYDDMSHIDEYVEKNIKDFFPWTDKDVMSMWDKGGFLFAVNNENEKSVKNLKLIYEAIKVKDAIIFLGGGRMAFGNAGLVIARLSTLPYDIKKMIKESHEDTKKLQEASEKTGIVKYVNDNLKDSFGGKAYYALSPAWTFKQNKKNTEYLVMYFLNPYDQQNNDSGWFTVEDLIKWVDYRKATDKTGIDPGPIPKNIK